MRLITDGAMAPARYDTRTIALHWLTAALVVLAWGMAQIIDYFPTRETRVDARSVHVVLGCALAIVIVLRLVHRAGAGRALPPADAGPLHLVAKAAHYALYGLLIAQVLLGFANVWLRGDSIFNLFTLPGTTDKALRTTIGDLHGTIATVLLILAGLHAAAALFHHFVWRDNVLRRMLPGGS